VTMTKTMTTTATTTATATTTKTALVIFMMIACVFVERASAETGVSSVTAIGSTSFTQNLTLAGTLGEKTKPDPVPQKGSPGGAPSAASVVPAPQSDLWGWNLGYTYAKTTALDPATNQNVTDKTQAFNGGFSWRQPTHWSLGAGLAYAATPDENLTSFAEDVSIGYKLKFGRAVPGSGESRFRPSLRLREHVTQTAYNQSFSTSAATRKKVRVVNQVNSIHQIKFDTALTYEVSAPVTLVAGYARYTYDRDINAFLNNLDSARAIRTGAAGFASTVYGLPQSSVRGEVDLYPSEDWEIDISEMRVVSASDGSQAHETGIEVFDDVRDFLRLGVGFQYESSSQLIDRIYHLSAEVNF
jgi:hypothetical protein